MNLQQIKQEAEQEFDEKYHEIVQAWKLDIHICNIEQNLKQFLSSQIEKAVAEVLKSVLVEEYEEHSVYKPNFVEGYNSAIQAIKAKIKNLGIEIYE